MRPEHQRAATCDDLFRLCLFLAFAALLDAKPHFEWDHFIWGCTTPRRCPNRAQALSVGRRDQKRAEILG
jgi:hypothetical protein